MIRVIRNEDELAAWEEANREGWFVNQSHGQRVLHRAGCYHGPFRYNASFPKFCSESREDLEECARPDRMCDCLEKGTPTRDKRYKEGTREYTARLKDAEGYVLETRVYYDESQAVAWVNEVNEPERGRFADYE